MPLPGNYHTHTRYCDGFEEPEAHAAAAKAKGFRYLGFSAHAPLPFETGWTMAVESLPEYMQAVRVAQRRNHGVLGILLGLEVDFLPGVLGPGSPQIRKLGLDYTIGSVHFLAGRERLERFPWTVDGPEGSLRRGLAEDFIGDVRKLVETYYQRIAEMAERSPPDIVGHLDLIKKSNGNGQFFSEQEPWYRQAVESALQRIASSGCLVEVNTGGIVRNTSGTLYPSEWILAECLKKDIPIVVSSDAHRPDEQDGYFSETVSLLRDIGFSRVTHLTLAGRRQSLL